VLNYLRVTDSCMVITSFHLQIYENYNFKKVLDYDINAIYYIIFLVQQGKVHVFVCRMLISTVLLLDLRAFFPKLFRCWLLFVFGRIVVYSDHFSLK
jgi:hypothetical protein